MNDRARRAALWALRASARALIVALTLLSIAAGAGALLLSDFGSERVRRRLVAAAGEALAGAVTVERLRLGLGRLVVEGVVLWDPTGREVARAAALEARVALGPLIGRRLVVEELRVLGPVVTTAPDGSLAPLAQALAPRRAEAADAAAAPTSRITIELRRLTVEGGALRAGVGAAGARGAGPPLTGEGLAVEGTGRLELPALLVAAELTARARVATAAGASPFLVRARITPASTGTGRHAVSAVIEAGSSRVAVDGSVRLGSSAEAPSAHARAGAPPQPQLRTVAAPPNGGAAPPGRAPRAASRAGVRAPVAVPPGGAPAAAAVPPGRLGAAAGGPPGAEPAAVELDAIDAVVRPETLAALLGRSPLRTSIALQGRATWTSPRAWADLRLRSDGGTVSVRGAVDLRRLRADRLAVDAEDLNLARLFEGAPRSALAATFELDGGGRTLADVDGTLALRAPVGRISGRPIGPLRLLVRADEGVVWIDALELGAPGLAARARGSFGPRQLRGAGALVVSDVALTTRSVLGLPAVRRLAASGRGALHFRLGGTPKAPALAVTATAPALRVGTAALRGVKLDVDLPDLFRPGVERAALAIDELRVGARRVRQIAFAYDATSRGRLHLSSSARLPAPLALRAAGRWLEPGRAVRLDQLVLTSQAAPLALRAPATIAWAEDELRIEGLALAGGDQLVTLDLRKRPTALDAEAHLALDLAPLAALAGRPLAGRVALALRVRGSLAAPDGRLDLRVADSRIGAVGPISLGATIDLRRARVSGRIETDALGASARALFALPASWPWPPAAPIEAELALAPFELAEARARLAALPGFERWAGLLALGGRASARVALGGDAARPRLEAAAAAEGLTLGGERLGDWTLQAEDRQGAGLGARLEIRGLGASHSAARARAVGGAGPPDVLVDVRTGWPAGELGRRPAALAEAAALARPLALEARIERLPLPTLGRLARLMGVSHFGPIAAAELVGTASLEAALSGPARAPLGRIALRLAGAGAPQVPPTDVDVIAVLDAARVSLDAHLAQRRPEVAATAPLIALSSSVELPPERRLDGRAWLAAPLSLKARIGPVRLARRGPRLEAAPLAARLEGALEVSGSALTPRAALRLAARGMTLGARPLGEARLEARYADLRPAIEVRVDGAAGGSLALTAKTAGPLPLTALRAPGFSPARLPIELDLTARSFGLELVSGLIPELQQLAGRLNARAALRGPAADPQLSGSLSIGGGAAHVAGYGRVEDFALDLRGDDDRVELRRLSLRSGRGRFDASGAATRRSDAGFDLTLGVKADKLPVVVAGRRLGELALRASARGRAGPGGVRIAPLAIGEARLDLEGESPKALQDLERPADVVYLRAGRPADPAEEARLAALLPHAPAGPTPAGRAHAPPGAGRGVSAPRGAAASGARVPFEIEVVAPRNLWVRGPDATVELGLSDGFRITSDGAAKVYGSVEAHRGQIAVYGRRFDVARESRATWQGAIDAPSIDARIDHLSQNENVRIWITAKGPRDRLAVEFHASEALSQSEIVTLLVTGRRALARKGPAAGVDGRSEAASLVGGLLASELRRSVLRNVPIDVLQIGTSQVEAGAYLTERLYVGYVRRWPRAQRYANPHAVRLEYALTPRWSVEGEWEYGELPSGAADLVWRRRY